MRIRVLAHGYRMHDSGPRYPRVQLMTAAAPGELEADALRTDVGPTAPVGTWDDLAIGMHHEVRRVQGNIVSHAGRRG